MSDPVDKQRVMTVRPDAVAFDIIETTFSLSSLRPRLTAHGFAETTLEVWFARTLRDAFALAATDTYASFQDIATATLQTLASEQGRRLSDQDCDEVLAGFGELLPQPDAVEAFRMLTNANIRIAALSNGAAATTSKLLDAARLSPMVERVMSIADIGKWKPRQEIYRHAADTLGVEPGRLALVATHAWDVHGAKCAGLVTGFVARGQPYPPVMRAPDILGETLADVARAIIALPSA